MSFAQEVVNRTVAQGVLATILAGAEAVIPSTGKVVHFRETGGAGPWRVHNTGAYPKYRRPAMQVVVHADGSEEARALAYQVYDALTIRDMYLGSTWYLQIEPQQEPYDYGIDANQRSQWAFNILTLKRPS